MEINVQPAAEGDTEAIRSLSVIFEWMVWWIISARPSSSDPEKGSSVVPRWMWLFRLSQFANSPWSICVRESPPISTTIWARASPESPFSRNWFTVGSKTTLARHGCG